MFEEFFRRRRFHKLERESQLDFRIGDIGIDGPKLTRRKNAMRQLHSLFAEESYPVLLRCLADRRVGPVATELFAQDGPAGFDAVRDAAARSKDAMLHANAVKVVANEAVSHLDFLEEELAWGLEQGATDLWSEVANTLVDCGAEDRVVSHAAAALADQSRDESTQLEVLYALRDLGTRPSIEALAAAVMDSGDDSYVQKRLRATIEELKRPESVADVEALTELFLARYRGTDCASARRSFARALRTLGWDSPEGESNEFARSLEAFDGDALLRAAESGDHDGVRFQLSLPDADPDVSGGGRITPLMYATHYGHTEVVRALLNAGASIDRGNSEGWTAIMAASQQGALDLVELLADAGADLGFIN